VCLDWPQIPEVFEPFYANKDKILEEQLDIFVAETLQCKVFVDLVQQSLTLPDTLR
jgi:hypothetical protein